MAFVGLGQCTSSPPAAREPLPAGTESLPDASFAADVTGVWNGHVDLMDFGDETGALTIILTRNAKELSGGVIFGTETARTEPQGPDGGRGPIDVTFGRAYTARDLRVDGDRVRLRVELSEPFDDWCVAQRPRTDIEDTDAWGCGRGSRRGARCALVLADGPAAPMTDGGRPIKMTRVVRDVPVDCERVDWCEMLRGRCACTDDGCKARRHGSIAVDLVVRGDVADGSVALREGSRSIRLRRKSP